MGLGREMVYLVCVLGRVAVDHHHWVVYHRFRCALVAFQLLPRLQLATMVGEIVGGQVAFL